MKKENPAKTLLSGAVAGGLAMLASFTSSWMFMPWHEHGMRNFFDPAAGNLQTTWAGLGKTFLLFAFASGLLTLLMREATAAGRHPMPLAMAAGMLIGALAYSPYMIWYRLPALHTFFNIMDFFVAITLAGGAISALVLRTGARRAREKKSGRK